MTQPETNSESLGTFTVLDMLLFVCACSVSMVLIRLLRPPGATLSDYLLLTAYCGPAGVSVFGIWAVRRQFLESNREELFPGEWLWILMGGGWISATPMMLAAGGQGVRFYTGLMAVAVSVPGAVALVQSMVGGRKPWTHWAGIALCLMHMTPALLGGVPALWMFVDQLYDAVLDIWGLFPPQA